MSKFYYIANVKPNKNKGGIPYKIYKQMTLLKNNGYFTKFIYLPDKSTTVGKIVSCFPLCSFKQNFDTLNKLDKNSKIYIRYDFCDYQIIKKLKKIKENDPATKVAIEIPTFPYDGENRSLKMKPLLIKDRFWRKQLYKYVDKIITFSNDDYIYGISTIKISNGVDTNRIKIRSPKKTDSINLVAVAHFGFWHGYDRMIEGLHKYYNGKGKKRNIKFYIVGYGDKKTENKYRELIKNYNLQDRVVLTGKKFGKDLDYYYDICDLGIDSMGRHRSSVYYNSSLKGKEYLAKGLPIVSGVKTELDSVKNFKYYLRVPANDTPVNIDNLLNFYDSIYKHKNKLKIAEDIRSFCVNNFDMDICFKKVIDWYKN